MKRVLIIPDIDHLDSSLELAKEYGAGFEYNDFSRPEILASRELTDHFAALYTERQLPELITSHGAFYDVNVFSLDPDVARISEHRILQSIYAARCSGAESIIFHSGYNPMLLMENYCRDWLLGSTDYWGSVAQNHPDINFYIENMHDVSPEPLALLGGELGGNENFGICLDVAHACLSPTPFEQWCKALGKYVRHVHINDNDLHFDLHLPVGDGMLNWGLFFDMYNQYFSNASVLVEVTGIAGQRRSLEFLRQRGFFK